MNDPIIALQNISKRYKNKVALENVSFQVPQGVVYGLLGPNGAGKTTSIRIITQIAAPDSGTILFKGVNMKPSDIYKLGYMPEERGLYKKMKVREQIMYFAQLKGMKTPVAKEAMEYWIDTLGMGEWADKKTDELSKGMQQKVQFVVTVINKPDFIILDEPFSGFDPVNADLIRNELLKLRDQGTTIMLSTHRIESVEELCSHVCMINHAKLVLDGDIPTIRSQYKENIFKVTLQPNPVPGTDVFHSYDIPGWELLRGEEAGHLGQSLYFKSTTDSQNINSLLTPIMATGQLVAFNEVLPSVKDIFIQLAGSAIDIE